MDAIVSILGGLVLMALFFIGVMFLLGIVASIPMLMRQKKEAREREYARQVRAVQRDSERQGSPYKYEIGRHANETLALRYGIANIERKNGRIHDCRHIRLQKVRRIEGDTFLVKISDFRNREAHAVIEKGTEYVKTFLPLDKRWFEENRELETVLKGNRTMHLTQIANFHVSKTVGRSRRKRHRNLDPHSPP